MGKGIAIVVIAIVAVAGLIVFGYITVVPAQTSATMPIEISVSDLYSTTAVPDTCDVLIYLMIDAALGNREGKLDLSSGDVDTVMPYTTGETLYVKTWDPTDTSYCTSYFTWTVPSPTAYDIENKKFSMVLQTCDMDDANNDGTKDWDPSLEENDGTAMAASSLQDASTQTWTTNYAYWELFVYNDDPDTGYVNSWNFEDSVKNNLYVWFQISGTGWDRVSIVSGATATFEKNDILYAYIPLTSDQAARDLSGGSSFIGDRDGIHQMHLILDFRGFQSGDNVTFTYGLKGYGDWDNFHDNNNWGPDLFTISELIYVQY